MNSENEMKVVFPRYEELDGVDAVGVSLTLLKCGFPIPKDQYQSVKLEKKLEWWTLVLLGEKFKIAIREYNSQLYNAILSRRYKSIFMAYKIGGSIIHNELGPACITELHQSHYINGIYYTKHLFDRYICSLRIKNLRR